MKPRPCSLLLAVTALFIGGCLPSLQPFYTANDVFKDENLVGVYGDNKPKGQADETWTFSPSDENFYQLEMAVPKQDEPGKLEVVGQMEARLFKLGKHTCLDLKPTHDLLENGFSPWYQTSFIAGHVIFKVHKIDDQALTMSVPDYDWINKHLKDNQDSLAHQRDEKRLILTDTTARLQAFFLKYSDKIWAKPGKMVRLNK